MVRVGLVAYVEEQLERDIAQGRLPPCGQFGSEQKLARSYGVSRSTVREALRRLSARGLVVQHPGRKARAVALDESLTLENLGLALYDKRSSESRRLLEGYFSLKRQVLLELLADCCASASEAALDELGRVCFALWDAARWEPGARCAQLEFELLRMAARAADRPGHLLLIQSMQRALLGIAQRVLPLLGGESLRQWACCAMDALHGRDTEALQHKLPPLLRACDERVLGRLAPAPQGQAGPEPHRTPECVLGGPAPATGEDEALEARSSVEERGLLAPAAEFDEALEVAPRPQVESLPVGPDCGALLPRAPPGLNLCEPGAESVGGDLPGAALTNLSDCRTGFCASSPEGGLQPESPPAGSRGAATRHQHPPTTAPVGCAPLAPPLPTSQDNLPRERLQPFPSSSLMRLRTPSPEGSSCGD